MLTRHPGELEFNTVPGSAIPGRNDRRVRSRGTNAAVTAMSPVTRRSVRGLDHPPSLHPSNRYPASATAVTGVPKPVLHELIGRTRHRSVRPRGIRQNVRHPRTRAMPLRRAGDPYPRKPLREVPEAILR